MSEGERTVIKAFFIREMEERKERQEAFAKSQMGCPVMLMQGV